MLRVTDYAYAKYFLEMVKALMRKRIPLRAYGIEDVLNYLTGESYFGVNTLGEHSINYCPGDRKLLRHIEWDEPKLLKWTRRKSR